MNKNEFIKALEELQIKYDAHMLQMLEIYKDYLKEYNEHTNLTAIKDDEGIYLKHFYDSLTICKACDLYSVSSLLDVGSGAGFPGMVLKIFFPNLQVTLLDANNKKTTFLKNLATKLNIDVCIVNKRCEEYAKDNLNSFDLVTSRAVANLRVLAELCLPMVKVGGIFVPLKGNINDELDNAMDTIEAFKAIIEKRVEFNLYQDSGIRNILVVRKRVATNKESLRPYDKILKKPLKNNSK